MTVWRGGFWVGWMGGGGRHAPGRQRESRAPMRRDGADTAATSAALPCGAALFHFGTVPLGRYTPRAARVHRAPGMCCRACSGRAALVAAAPSSVAMNCVPPHAET